MSKGAIGLLAAYWPEDTARYAHVPLERVTQACVHRPAESQGSRPALVSGTRQVSFAELALRARHAAAALRERLEPGARLALVLDDPLELLPLAVAALDADLLAWYGVGPIDPAALRAFEPELVVARTATAGAPAPLTPEALDAEPGEAPPGRPKLRNPVLALARPGGGEALHSHRTLLAQAIAFGSFFLLEPGAATVLLEPPSHWLSLAAWLGTWQRGGTVHAAWCPDAPPPTERVDYVVGSAEEATRRHLAPGSRPWPGRIGLGALVGVEDRLSTARRRRMARRLRAPVLTVFGRNDLGPVVASHPTWFLDDAVGIPLPNVDLRPLDPADGRELAIGWDAVEEAELGIKSTLAPAGGELVGTWLRTRRLGHVDPTGLYFLRGRVAE